MSKASRAQPQRLRVLPCALALLVVAFLARREARKHAPLDPDFSPFAASASTAPPASPLVAGYEFHLESDAPYKLFTSPQIRLRVALEKPAREAKTVKLQLVARDFFGRIAARDESTLHAPPGGTPKFNAPVLSLPRLGWYQIEATLRDAHDNRVLASRAQFVGRTFLDDTLPIPAKAQTGWDDLITHRMIGMRLHRFDLNTPEELDQFAPQIRQARALKIPYFILLITPQMCEPESIRAVLQKLHALGDDAPDIEIINEPNLKMRASHYIEILKEARTQIEATCPHARVLGPALCGAQLFWIENFLSRGGGDLIDVFTLHIYERNGSMDADHWLRKFSQVRGLMQKYGCRKPLWQTEHGFVGDVPNQFLRPQWQARQITLEQNCLARFGVGPSEYFYYYVNDGGYRDFSAYLVDGAREIYPAALMTRTRAHLLQNKTWRRALDFGEVGNRLLIGDEYSGGGQSVLVLQNCGALRAVEVEVKAQNARAFDCFGNEQKLKYSHDAAQLWIGRYPVYVFTSSPVSARLVNELGTDIAPRAQVLCDDAKAQGSLKNLTDGLLEFDFHDEPQREGFLAFDNHLPLDVTLQWPRAQRIQSAILYGSLADNDKSTPLAYDLWAHQNGAWQKVDQVRQNPSAQFFPQGNARLSNYDNPWIFVHRFPAPIEADALRFHFLQTTRGQIPTADLAGAAHSELRPRVELREVQVFAPQLQPNNGKAAVTKAAPAR